MSNEFRKFTRMLVDNGYHRVRIRGSHYIYQDSNGCSITINKDINRCVRARLIKEYHLIQRH